MAKKSYIMHTQQMFSLFRQLMATKITLFPPRLELGTFRVLGERDNHYTTETHVYLSWMGRSNLLLYYSYYLLY